MLTSSKKIGPPVNSEDWNQAFAKRLNDICDGNPAIPPKNKGRLLYIATKFEEVSGEKVTIETVRKWLSGEARPRAEKSRFLARALMVQESWLALGRDTELEPRERDGRLLSLSGASCAVAAIVQLDGGQVSVPPAKDPKYGQINFYAIVRGTMYAVHVALEVLESNKRKFFLPLITEDNFLIGLVRAGSSAFEMLNLSSPEVLPFAQKVDGKLQIEVERQGTAYYAVAKAKKVRVPVIPGFTDKLPQSLNG